MMVVMSQQLDKYINSLKSVICHYVIVVNDDDDGGVNYNISINQITFLINLSNKIYNFPTVSSDEIKDFIHRFKVLKASIRSPINNTTSSVYAECIKLYLNLIDSRNWNHLKFTHSKNLDVTINHYHTIWDTLHLLAFMFDSAIQNRYQQINYFEEYEHYLKSIESILSNIYIILGCPKCVGHFFEVRGSIIIQIELQKYNIHKYFLRKMQSQRRGITFVEPQDIDIETYLEQRMNENGIFVFPKWIITYHTFLLHNHVTRYKLMQERSAQSLSYLLNEEELLKSLNGIESTERRQMTWIQLKSLLNI
jgi:hypothetical protein